MTKARHEQCLRSWGFAAVAVHPLVSWAELEILRGAVTHTAFEWTEGWKATQNPSSSHRFILFQKWNRARQGTALKGLVESTKLLLFCRPVPLSYYFLLCLFIALLKTEYIFCCGGNKRLKNRYPCLQSLRIKPSSARNSAFLFCSHKLLIESLCWSPARTQPWAAAPLGCPSRVSVPSPPPWFAGWWLGKGGIGLRGKVGRGQHPKTPRRGRPPRQAQKHLSLASRSGKSCRAVTAGQAISSSRLLLRCRIWPLVSV